MHYLYNINNNNDFFMMFTSWCVNIILLLILFMLAEKQFLNYNNLYLLMNPAGTLLYKLINNIRISLDDKEILYTL